MQIQNENTTNVMSLEDLQALQRSLLGDDPRKKILDQFPASVPIHGSI